MALAIPTAHTPPGGWHGPMPPPILGDGDHELTPGVPDLRGVWQAVAVEANGAPVDDLRHVERIEQAGNRVVITSGGVIHDMVADGTLENGVNDVSAFTNEPIRVAATFEDGVLVLRPNNEFVAVTRELDGENLVWTLVPFNRVTRMRRFRSEHDHQRLPSENPS